MSPWRHPLDGISAKLDRAKEHLAALEQDIDQREEAKEFGLGLHLDTNSGDQTVYAFAPYELRVRWGILVGDVVHNARAALDHVVCRLVESNGRTPTTQTAFPIYPSLADYKKKQGARKIDGVPIVLVPTFEGLQPVVNDPQGLLFVLASLDNVDKHNLVNVSAFVANLKRIQMRGSAAANLRVFSNQAQLDGIEDGADLLKISFNSGTALKVVPDVRVTFAEPGPGGGEDVVPLLKRIVDRVEQVIPQFGLTAMATKNPTWRPPPGSANVVS